MAESLKAIIKMEDWIKYLKENEVYEVKKETRAVEPEEVVTGLNHGYPLHNLSSLLDSQCHLGYDHL